VGARDLSAAAPTLSVRTRFDRFPATAKGAFVLRGEDSNPHQVKVTQARATPLAGRGARPVPVQPVTVDVPPHENLFVPFELSTVDMEAGWYDLEMDLEVDGSPRTLSGDRRLLVSWPRGTLRTGPLPAAGRVVVEGISSTVERIQCSAESTTVRFTCSPPEPLSLRLEADGTRLPALGGEFDETTGRGTAVAYPLLRSHRHLALAFRLDRPGKRQGTAVLDLDLP
jgi:hypothetical protein